MAGKDRTGKVRTGEAGEGRQVLDRQGGARQAGHGAAEAGHGMYWRGRRGRLGWARRGLERQAGLGTVRRVKAGRGEAGKSRTVSDERGREWQA